MQNDRLSVETKHEDAAREIVKHIITLGNGKLIIGISGESGSGRAELSHEIAWQLVRKNRQAKILHTDNYYKMSPHNRDPWRRTQSSVEKSIGPSEYNWESINSNLADFRDGKKDYVTLPYIDLLTDHEDQLQTNFSGIQYLVIEGLYAIRAEVDLRIFIDITYHETLEKLERLEKDVNKLSRGREILDDWRLKVLECEHKAARTLLEEITNSKQLEKNFIISSEFVVIPAAEY